MIIGAGIIGLAVARQFLTGSDLSVAVVDKAVPCSGATGAGTFFFSSLYCVWFLRNVGKVNCELGYFLGNLMVYNLVFGI